MTNNEMLSAVVPVCDLLDESGSLVREYLEELSDINQSFELIYVLDGEHVNLLQQLNEVAASDPRLRIIQLSKNFGEATALTAGFSYARGSTILTLPAYRQIARGGIATVLGAMDDCDIAVATRDDQTANASVYASTRRKAFHWLVRAATGQSFRDMGCGVRALKRSVADELPLYGDQFRFFPVLAARRGFRVNQVPVQQPEGKVESARHGPRSYLARLLDIFALIFLTRFTKKPLRFFGTVGSIVFVFGSITLVSVVIQRLFFDVALADRPALFLASLLIVLGAQIFALGLLGELVIFTHAKDMKEYTIDKIVN